VPGEVTPLTIFVAVILPSLTIVSFARAGSYADRRGCDRGCALTRRKVDAGRARHGDVDRAFG